MNLRSQRFWVAMVLTLSLHAMALFFLWMQPAGRYAAAANAFIPVEFADLQAAESVAPTLEQQLRAQMESRVSNLVADANASASSEIQSTSAQEEARMAQEVQAELRAMEQAEFERLAANQKDFGLEGVPDDGQNGQVNTLTGWDQRYDGRVIVSYDVVRLAPFFFGLVSGLCSVKSRICSASADVASAEPGDLGDSGGGAAASSWGLGWGESCSGCLGAAFVTASAATLLS